MICVTWHYMAAPDDSATARSLVGFLYFLCKSLDPSRAQWLGGSAEILCNRKQLDIIGWWFMMVGESQKIRHWLGCRWVHYCSDRFFGNATPAQGESGNHCCWGFNTEEKFGHPSGNWHLEDFDCGQHSSLVDWTGLRRLEDEWRLLGFSSTENSCRWQPAFMQGSTIHKASFHKCQKRHTESMIWATIWVWPRALRKWSCCL